MKGYEEIQLKESKWKTTLTKVKAKQYKEKGDWSEKWIKKS